MIERFIMGCLILTLVFAMYGALPLGRGVGIRIASDDYYNRSTCVFCITR